MEDSKKTNTVQKEILETAKCRPVAYIPALATITGSVKAALLLSQLLYWYGKGKWGKWTYKTIEELKIETGLSRKEQDTAIGKLKSLNILEVELKGIPRRRFFKISLDVIYKLISSKLTIPIVQKGQTITYSTQDITTDTTTERTVVFNKYSKEIDRMIRWAYERAAVTPSCSKDSFREAVITAIERAGYQKVYKCYDTTNAIQFLTDIKNL